MAPIDKKGPFNSELSAKAIMDLMSDVLFPTNKDLHRLSLDVASYRQGFINSYLRFELSSLEARYRAVNRRLLAAYHTYETPDELFKGIDTGGPGPLQAMIMGDYFKMQNVIKPHFEEAFRLSEIVDRTLARYAQSADQRVASSLSVLAITATIIGTIIDLPSEIQSPRTAPSSTTNGLHGGSDIGGHYSDLDLTLVAPNEESIPAIAD